MRLAGQLNAIDEIVIANESDSSSSGMLLAATHDVDRAPFFVVERDGQPTAIYTVYFKFVKEVLNAQTEEADEIQEILNDNPDLDFI